MTITIDSLAEMLNTHTRMFSQDLQTKTRLGLEMETTLTQRQSSGEYYVVENAEATEVLQPYQGTFTPKGTVTHSEEKIRVRPIKIDLQFDEVQLEKWWNSWQAMSRFTPELDPQSWTYARYILEKELIPKFQDDLNNAAWLGEYVAPTPGTAGDAVESVDGFKKIIADLVTANKIQKYDTGSITSSNIREKVEEFLGAIPDHITKKGGKLLMAPKLRRWYFYDYRGEFSALPSAYPANEGGMKEIMADDYNIGLVAMATMTGSSRFVFLPNGRENMVWVSMVGKPVYPQLIFVKDARVLKCYGTIYRGYGFEYPQEVWVNDQV